MEENLVIKIDLLRSVEIQYNIEIKDEEVETICTIDDLTELIKNKSSKNKIYQHELKTVETRDKAKTLFDRIKTINRYCGEDSAVRLVMIEFIDAFLKKPDPKHWEEVKKEMTKL